MNPDFGAASQDYAQHRAGFPDSLFERLCDFGVGKEGQKIVDLGTGTGSLARGFALRGSLVTGIDHSSEMLDAARGLDADAGVSVDYRVGKAEETGLPDSSCDVVTAGQCWHWFDRTRAANELRRILKPGGIAVIAHFDWIPLQGNLVQATEELIESHNPAWTMGGGTGIHGLWPGDLAEAGFRDIETFSYDLQVPYTATAWRGRIRASAGVGGSMTGDEVDDFDSALEQLLANRFPQATLMVPHRVFAVIAHSD